MLRVGKGIEIIDDTENIEIPEKIIIKYRGVDIDSSKQKLIDSIFPDLAKNSLVPTYMTNRAILATKNAYLDKLIDKILPLFSGELRTFLSFDEAIDDTQNFYPEEFLNSLAPTGLPHCLSLKKNCPVMLLRNLDPSDGLCNGTRMVCKGFQNNVIHAENTVGNHSGKQVLIPRIPLSPADNEGYPFQFRRKQFPVRLCFAMTINKSQGQTIPITGVYLPELVFSNGHLYVALSRGTSMMNTKVMIKPDLLTNVGESQTKNVVYKEVLDNFPSSF